MVYLFCIYKYILRIFQLLVLINCISSYTYCVLKTYYIIHKYTKGIPPFCPLIFLRSCSSNLQYRLIYYCTHTEGCVVLYANSSFLPGLLVPRFAFWLTFCAAASGILSASVYHINLFVLLLPSYRSCSSLSFSDCAMHFRQSIVDLIAVTVCGL